MTVLERVHAAQLERGWMVASARALGLPDEHDVIAALSPALEPDPRGHGKHHARDVIGWHENGVFEAGSAAHVDGTDDYSRFELLSDARTAGVPQTILSLIPPLLARENGRMSADYFRYAPGAGAGPHQDGFGDLVAIWVLDRAGAGAESFLIDHQGRDVLRGPIGAGHVLIFRDEMFLHGVTPLESGHRDALIFIRLKDGGLWSSGGCRAGTT